MGWILLWRSWKNKCYRGIASTVLIGIDTPVSHKAETIFKVVSATLCVHCPCHAGCDVDGAKTIGTLAYVGTGQGYRANAHYLPVTCDAQQ